MPTEYEYSDYGRDFMIGGINVDIEIFRNHGTHAWHMETSIDGEVLEWPHTFIADKAAYDAAIKHIKERGLNPDMFENDFEIIDSPLNQRLLVEGHSFEITIYKGVDEPDWILEIINEKGTSFIPEERFKTDSVAMGAALADFENEPIEEFLG